MDEAGIKGFDSTSWFGLIGPAGLPGEVVTRLNQAMRKASEDKSLRDQLSAVGCDPDFLDAAKTSDKVIADHAKWGRVIRDAKITAE
jgi:tripartite-type tricarboxylate transporter receptor subunit TctC